MSYVALTKAFPYFQPELLTDFADKDDFVQVRCQLGEKSR